MTNDIITSYLMKQANLYDYNLSYDIINNK